MMICKADFEELFPESFAPEPQLSPKVKAHQSSAESLGRWEDDGGQSAAPPQPSTSAHPQSPLVANHWSAPMRIAAQWAMAPPLMAVWPAMGLADPDWRPPFQ